MDNSQSPIMGEECHKRYVKEFEVSGEELNNVNKKLKELGSPEDHHFVIKWNKFSRYIVFDSIPPTNISIYKEISEETDKDKKIDLLSTLPTFLVLSGNELYDDQSLDADIHVQDFYGVWIEMCEKIEKFLTSVE